MTELELMIIDKLVIGVLILIVGLWINKKLSQYKSNLEEGMENRVRIAEARLPAYQKLWSLTSITNPHRDNPLTSQEIDQLQKQMEDWFYTEGQGLFLSQQVYSAYRDALAVLGNNEINSSIVREIKEKFITLRKTLKNEIGIYGKVSNYKYYLVTDYIHDDIGIDIDLKTDFIEIQLGTMTIKEGYSWNGIRGYAVDRMNFMRATLVHDALYQLMRLEELPRSYRRKADLLFKKIALEDGVSLFSANLAFWGVRQFGQPAIQTTQTNTVHFTFDYKKGR
ncbi:MAG: DUF1353 domain-containing protein [Spirochaetaceae bacterium]|nr:DUF1353 domain-containing protein [Spirochaetaceae bacterium]